MLDAMNSLPDPKVAVGIKISLLDPVKNLFAYGQVPGRRPDRRHAAAH